MGGGEEDGGAGSGAEGEPSESCAGLYAPTAYPPELYRVPLFAAVAGAPKVVPPAGVSVELGGASALADKGELFGSKPKLY